MNLSTGLSTTLFLSILLHWVHFTEVVLTKFYLEQSFLYSIASIFKDQYDATYFASHIVLYILLTLIVLLVLLPKYQKYFLILYTWIFISEAHHIIMSLSSASYTPGAISSLLYILLGIFYIKYLARDWKNL